jgi:hypothetical protein
MWVTILRPTTWPPLFWNQIPVSPKLCTQSLFSMVIPYTSRIAGLSPITQVLSTLASAWKLHLGQNLEWRETWAILGGTTPDRHCHYKDSSVHQWKSMDPLHSSKVSTSERTLDHVLKTWWHKSNFKKTLVWLLFLLQLGNSITTISVPQASSPITIKFDACLAIPCGNLKNQCYIQGL